jgi:hypothetical protein
LDVAGRAQDAATRARTRMRCFMVEARIVTQRAHAH